MSPATRHLSLVTALLAFPLAAAEADGSAAEFFEKKIRPVLADNCYKCHSSTSEKIKGKLRVDSRAALVKGGETGPAIVPGQPEKSLLITAIGYGDRDLQMPPKSKLPDEAIRNISAWIKDGAPWPVGQIGNLPDEGQTGNLPNAGQINNLPYEKLQREHWAFQPVKKPPPPEVKDKTWPHDYVNRFILAKLEAKNLKPAPPAGKATLLRRAYYDLTGLPPSAEEIESFLKDDAPDAFARVVDKLLASPHFGERWGRHWLDVARYAESSGGGRIRPFENAWRYRDYVIAAFNNDKPYNVFITEQIAGDLLKAEDADQRRDQIVATGFLALGPKNLDTQDKDLLRMDVADEQIDTMGRTVMGLTLGCARCHDHKFDPVPARDYYALAGIFRSTKTLLPGNVSGFVESPIAVSPEIQRAAEEHARAEAALEEKIQKAKAASGVAAKAGKVRIDPAQLAGFIVDDTKATLVGDWIASTHNPGYVGDGYLHDDGKNKGQMSATFATSLPKAGLYEVRMAYATGTNRAANVPVSINSLDGEKVVEVDQRKEPHIDGVFLSLGKHRFEEGNDGWVTISNKGTQGSVIVDAIQFIPAELPESSVSALEPTEKHAEVKLDAAAQKAAAAEAKKLEAELKELKKKAPVVPRAMAVVDEPQTDDYNLCIRGDVHRLGEKVPRGFLSLVKAAKVSEIKPPESGRRALAEWLVQPDHPLTSRVMVNRIWSHLFVNGLVRTTDNFGLVGEAPSHPELLDWLATRFVAEGWSVKRMIRRLMLSRAYQMSGAGEGQGVMAEAGKADPENRLLWRMNRRRLEVEALRDSILAVSGQLDLAAGGPAVAKPAKPRRSVYMPVLREEMNDMFETFDFADPNLVIGDRSRSTLATQALYLLNSPFALEQSRIAAEFLMKTPVSADAARIEGAWRRALGRAPSSAEREMALRFLREHADPKEAWSGIFQAIFASIDFRYIN